MTTMTPISAVRFNAIAGYARLPQAAIFGEELSYFEIDNGSIVGMIIIDREDGDFAGMVFAPDRRLRYRSAYVTSFHSTVERAQAALAEAMQTARDAPPQGHHQGDEQGEPVDFFAPLKAQAQLHPDFVRVANDETMSPARSIIEPMMRWYEDADGNFIEQFQTTGFDQRIWELYLFATLIELGYRLDRSDPVPDFSCSDLFEQFTVEAVTVGPTRKGGMIVPPPPLDSDEQRLAYLKQYMPIKFGSALFSKLRKQYWKRHNVAGKPFLLAVADFSSHGSMTYTRSALEAYLYGYDHDWEHDPDGKLLIRPRKLREHVWGEKRVPSGFFDLPEAENVSAVLSTTAGTITKFNRMGVLGGFGSGRVLLVREGTAVDHDPNAVEPKVFRAVVNSAGYEESWIEGLSVYHNPRATNPLSEDCFPGAAHHFLLEDGNIRSHTPDFHPLASMTRQWAPVDVEAALAQLKGRTHVMWTRRR